MYTVINMIGILQTVILKTDIRHIGKDVRVVIPILRKSTKRSIIEVDWSHLEPAKEGNDTVVEFAGVRYHIWDDFHDYTGRYNDKEDIMEHLNKYQSWSYEKEYDEPNGHHCFRFTVYWKAMEVEKEATLSDDKIGLEHITSELDGFVDYIYDYSITDKELEFAEKVAFAVAKYLVYTWRMNRSNLDGFVDYIYDYSITDKELEFAEKVAFAVAKYKELMLRKKMERIRKEYDA